MRLERLGPASFRMTLHAYELATLTSAARWAAEHGGEGTAPEARAQLHTVLAAYEAELARLSEPVP